MTYDETFWIAVAFCILVACLYKIGKKFIVSGLDDYIQDISKKLDSIEKIHAESIENFEKAKKEYDYIENKKVEILESATKYAKNLESEYNEKIEYVTQRHIKIAEESIEVYRNKIEKDIANISGKIITQSIREAFRHPENEDTVKNLQKESLNYLVQ